jgi:RNA polymerase sigma factor (sigma-70 family)
MVPKALVVAGRHAGGPRLSREGDERLIDLARDGSAIAFDELVSRYRPALLNYCRRYLAADRAEDAVQLTFLRAYEQLHTWDGDFHLRSWLFRVAHNAAIDGLRDRGSSHAQMDESIDGVEQPHQAAERQERVRYTVTAIQALPQRQRDAVVLREFEGRSYQEIASRLGITVGATRQLLLRARDTLRLAGEFPASAPPTPREAWIMARRATDTVGQLGCGRRILRGDRRASAYASAAPQPT